MPTKTYDLDEIRSFFLYDDISQESLDLVKSALAHYQSRLNEIQDAIQDQDDYWDFHSIVDSIEWRIAIAEAYIQYITEGLQGSISPKTKSKFIDMRQNAMAFFN